MFPKITVTDISGIFSVPSPKGRHDRVYNRPYYGLSFCTSGQITYIHNGIKTISDAQHAVILPQGETYDIYGDKTGTFPVINFTCTDTICSEIISHKIDNPDAYLRDFEKMQSMSVFDGNRTEIMSIFYHILHRLEQSNSVCGTILPAIKYLEKNYGNPYLTNAELAQQCNISEVYFRKLFIKHYGTTPKQFLIDTRINKAKQLLAENVLKINAVAAQCGFSNQYHFCRIFKEKTGLTPTEYSAQNKIIKI